MMSTTKEARKAHAQVKQAIMSGVMQKTNTCAICGEETTTVAHHPDYLEPLQVIWLCKSCHTKLHKTIDPHKEWKITPARKAWLDYLHSGITMNYQIYKEQKGLK